MTRDDLWAIYVAKNPKMGLNDDTHITLTSRGLKKLFDTAWERAHDAGFENGKAYTKAQDKASPMGDLFNDLFGSKK